MGLRAPLGEQDLSPNIPRTEERSSLPEESGLGIIRLPKLGKGMWPRSRDKEVAEPTPKTTGRGGPVQLGGRARGFY